MRLSYCFSLPALSLLLASPLALLGIAPQAAAQQATVPFVRKHIYPEIASAQPDIAAALQEAKSKHKRVLLDFGGDWCGDCQVLDIYFHSEKNLPLLEKSFVLVPVNVGRIDANLDIGARYGVNLQKGVPALAVLSPQGKSLYGQSGQFADMRHMDQQSVTDFLTQWKVK